MRRVHAISLAAATVAAASALLAPTATATPAPARAVGAASPELPSRHVLHLPAWQCRTGTTHPSANLTATGTVCARYTAGFWQGSGSVRLVATGRAVTGMLSRGVTRTPATESALESTPFTVHPGHPLVLALAGHAAAAAGDRAAAWTADIGISLDGRPGVLPTGPDGVAIDLGGRLYSPLVHRVAGTSVATSYRGTGTDACSSRQVPVHGTAGAGGVVGLCLGQTRATLTGDVPRLRYTAARHVPVVLTLVVDGTPAVTTLLDLPASPSAQTDVALPSSLTGVLRGERSAVLRLELAGATVTSAALSLHG